MTGTAIAGVIGRPISSGLLLFDGVLGLRGWRWLFVVEGVPALLLAPVVWRRLDARPSEARWLSDQGGRGSSARSRPRPTASRRPATTSPGRCGPPVVAAGRGVLLHRPRLLRG
ncbi:MAG: hypothetical protein R2708_26240 [Vicinamibacterales bacterium]